MLNNSADSAREQLLSNWVAQQLSLPTSAISLQSIASDAGFRRYFRFAQPSQWLAVDAPPQTEDTRQFVALAEFLSANAINTPKILAADLAQGLLLVEDFGDELLYRHLTLANAQAHYADTFEALLSFYRCPANPTLIPAYDQAMLRRELQIFSDWFVTALLGHSLNESEVALLASVFTDLEASALEQPQILVHRDFHSRNLILQPKGELGVIDFQGALWGACTYDLVSLLKDCYRRWPAAQVADWACDYHQTAIAAGLLSSDISATQFLQWFDWMGLQRHIKVLGIFARLHLRDGKAHYLSDLPLVIRYTLEAADAYPQLHAFAAWFRQVLLPRAETQSWYRDYRQAGDIQ